MSNVPGSFLDMSSAVGGMTQLMMGSGSDSGLEMTPSREANGIFRE